MKKIKDVMNMLHNKIKYNYIMNKYENINI